MIARKSIIMFASQLLVIVFSILTIKIVLSVLDPYEYGIFGYGFALSSMFLLFTDFNLSQVYFKRIAEGVDLKSYFSTYLSMKSILILITLLIYAIFMFLSFFVFKNIDLKALVISFIIFISFASDIFLNGFLSIYLAKRDVRVSQPFVVFSAIFSLLFVVLFVVPTHNIYIYSLSFLIKSLLGVLFMYYSLRNKLLGFRFRLDRKIAKNYISFIIPLLPLGIISFICDKIDPIMLKSFLSYKEVGLFVAAQKFNLFLLLASGSLMTILFSSFSEHAAAANYSRLEAISNKATKYISIPVTFMSVFVFFNTHMFVKLFMSKQFLPTVPIIQIFMFQVIFMSISRTFDSSLLAMERLKFLSFSGIAISLLGIGLTFILIPSTLFGIKMFGLGANGPAMKLFIMYALSVLINSIYLYVKCKIVIYWRFLLHILSAFMVGFVLQIFMSFNMLNEYLSFAMSFIGFLVAYCIVLILIQEITKDDLNYLLKVVGLKKA